MTPSKNFSFLKERNRRVAFTRIVAECPSHFFRSTPHAKHGPISRSAYFLHVPARPKLHFPTFCLLLGPAHISCVDLTSEESPLTCASSVCRSFRPQLASYSPGVLWRHLLIWLLTSLCLGTGWAGDAYGQSQFPGDGTNYSLTAVAPHIPYNPSSPRKPWTFKRLRGCSAALYNPSSHRKRE